MTNRMTGQYSLILRTKSSSLSASGVVASLTKITASAAGRNPR